MNGNQTTQIRAVTSSGQSYDSNLFARLSEIEDKHFWFQARNHLLSNLLGQIESNLAPGYHVLEVGSGTGNVLRVLERVCTRGHVIGLDLYTEGFQFSRTRCSSPLVQGNIQSLPFGMLFNIIGIFDVLEHIPEDLDVLKHLHAKLQPGGVLFVTVPAFQSLWSYFDDLSRHCRRYRLADLRNKLILAGFEIEFISYFMASIFPLVWLRRRLMRKISKGGNDNPTSSLNSAELELSVIPVFNQWLYLLSIQETYLLIRRKKLPFGTSLLAIARKTSKT